MLTQKDVTQMSRAELLDTVKYWEDVEKVRQLRRRENSILNRARHWLKVHDDKIRQEEKARHKQERSDRNIALNKLNQEQREKERSKEKSGLVSAKEAALLLDRKQKKLNKAFKKLAHIPMVDKLAMSRIAQGNKLTSTQWRMLDNILVNLERPSPRWGNDIVQQNPLVALFDEGDEGQIAIVATPTRLWARIGESMDTSNPWHINWKLGSSLQACDKVNKVLGLKAKNPRQVPLLLAQSGYTREAETLHKLIDKRLSHGSEYAYKLGCRCKKCNDGRKHRDTIALKKIRKILSA